MPMERGSATGDSVHPASRSERWRPRQWWTRDPSGSNTALETRASCCRTCNGPLPSARHTTAVKSSPAVTTSGATRVEGRRTNRQSIALELDGSACGVRHAPNPRDAVVGRGHDSGAAVVERRTRDSRPVLEPEHVTATIRRPDAYGAVLRDGEHPRAVRRELGAQYSTAEVAQLDGGSRAIRGPYPGGAIVRRCHQPSTIGAERCLPRRCPDVRATPLQARRSRRTSGDRVRACRLGFAGSTRSTGGRTGVVGRRRGGSHHVGHPRLPFDPIPALHSHKRHHEHRGNGDQSGERSPPRRCTQ